MSHVFSPIDSLKAELRAAGETLVDNQDVLRAVLSGCGDCIKILDLDGRLQFMSEGGKRVMEVDDFTALKGCPWPDLWADEANLTARNAIEAARQGKTAHFKGSADTAKGNSKHWDVQVSPIWGPDETVAHLLSISRDITAQWKAETALKDAAERQRLLTQEMNHRINNTLALVGAIASQTMRGTDVDAARRTFTARLQTLAEANKLLLQTAWDHASILEIVKRALGPHDPSPGRIHIEGPNLSLAPKQASSLSLAVHELATNATKYGALSNDCGTVAVTWHAAASDEDPEFLFQWTEKGGPAVPEKQPERKGFGSRLIQDVFAQDFGGAVELNFQPSGLVCTLRSPIGLFSGSSF